MVLSNTEMIPGKRIVQFTPTPIAKLTEPFRYTTTPPDWAANCAANCAAVYYRVDELIPSEEWLSTPTSAAWKREPRGAISPAPSGSSAGFGAPEPAARIVRQVATPDATGPCVVIGTGVRGTAVAAALANGTAAHALDFDDMCFVSLAHPSAPLVAAALAMAELADASGRALLDAYIVGFEIEGRLGRMKGMPGLPGLRG